VISDRSTLGTVVDRSGRTRTVGTPEKHAKIGVWVQPPGTLLRRSRGMHPEEIFEIVCAKSCNWVYFWFVKPSTVRS